ncbi:MAG: hypothetical protein JO057_16110, partial [Chloroflexi bacterium]|nr:hypothetical protein [Chloroflexota bacterium]
PKLVTGLYGLYIQGTPETTEPCGWKIPAIPPTPADMAPWQWQVVLPAIAGWWDQDEFNARANLNVFSADFVGTPNAPIGPYAVGMNQTAQAPQISLATDPNAPKPLTVTCADPRGAPPTMVIYPADPGSQSDRKTFTGAAGTASVQAALSVDDFSDWPLLAECAHGAAPSETSRIVIPASALPPSIWISISGANIPGTAGFECNTIGVSSDRTINVYPTLEGPAGPHHVSATVQAEGGGAQSVGYLAVSRSQFPAGDYQLTVTCVIDSPPLTATPLTLSTTSLPLPVTIRTGMLYDPPPQFQVYCDVGSAASSATITVYPTAQGPNSPYRRSSSGYVPGSKSVLLNLERDDFPAPGDYELTATCATNDTPPWTAAPVTFSTSDLPGSPPPFLLNITMNAAVATLYCDRDPQVTSPVTLSVAAQTLNAPAPVSVTGTDKTLALTLPPNYFPPGDYQLTATCVSSDTPPFTATPLTFAASQLPNNLSATPQGGLQLQISCLNPVADGIHIVAYPAEGDPNGPDAQTFDLPPGRPLLQDAIYTRRGNYDVDLQCTMGGTRTVSGVVPASAFSPVLGISTGSGGQLSCNNIDQFGQLTSPRTVSLAAQTPGAPAPLTATGSGKTLVLTVQPDYFPSGNYQLTATCASSETPPFTAVPLTLSSSQIPTGGPTATPTASPTSPAAPTPTATATASPTSPATGTSTATTTTATPTSPATPTPTATATRTATPTSPATATPTATATSAPAAPVTAEIIG